MGDVILYDLLGNRTDRSYTATELADIEAAQPTANDLIKQQIAELEASVTERRYREAVLGIDNGWLKNVNDEVTALRAKLTT